MKNFLRILIILLTILFFSLIVVSVKYASYKYSDYELETKVPEALEEIKEDIYINVGQIKSISPRSNKQTYKLEDRKLFSKWGNYKLINVTCNLNAICDFLDKFAVNEAFENVYKFAKVDKSQMDGTTPVLNYDDTIGMIFTNGYLTKVEAYDKKYVFDSNTNLSNFEEIKNEFGMGTFIACNEGSFISYKMLYTYGKCLVTFTSYYEDGRCNVCEIENIDRN